MNRQASIAQGRAPIAPARRCARHLCQCTLAICCSIVPLASPYAQPLALPPVHVQAPATASCVDVQVEGAESLSFDCLNQQLKAAAQDQADNQPAAGARDVTGTGAPTSVGTFSYTATSIRMGDAFGRSATPQRPPTSSFTSALVHPAPGAR